MWVHGVGPAQATVYLAWMTSPGHADAPGPAWCVEPAPIAYCDAVARMEAHVDAIAAGTAGERIWLVEHPPVITAGTSARQEDLVDPGRFDVIQTGRGGQFTYHGPGQRVIYPMLDLARRGRDVRAYVTALEQWAIASLADLGIGAFTSDAGTGIWGRQGGSIAKIGAIGIRVRRWISFHGLAINVDTDLSHYGAIVPCGIADHGVTSIRDLSAAATMADLDAALLANLPSFLRGETTCRGIDTKSLEADANYR